MSSMPPPPPEMPPPPPPPPPGMPPGGPYGAPYGYVPPAGGAANLAEWWQRGVAVVIDYLIIAAIAGIVAGPSVERTTTLGGGTSVHVRFGSAALTFVGWTLYAGLMNGLKGQTLGKMIFGIKVVRRDNGALLGAPLGLARAALHDVMWQLCCLPGLLDSLWPLWDKERQTLHDKAVSSVVVKTR